MPVFFNGQLLVTPTSASVVNDDAMLNRNLSLSGVAAFLGRSAGGKPKTILRFGSPEEALEELVDGELLDAVLKAFDPSNQTAGPAEVIAIRVQPATQATGIVKDAQGDDVINLKSQNFGLRENMLRWKIEPGTLSGFRMTTMRGTSYYSADNVGYANFSVHYTGDADTATITIAATTVTLAVEGQSDVVIDLVQFSTVQDLVDRMNSVDGFEAEVLDGNYVRPALMGLDFVTAQDVKTAAFTVRGDLQAVVDWFNSAREGYITAERVSTAGTKPAVADWKFLNGGTDGNTTFGDWADAFEALQTVDVGWLTPVTGDPAVHAMADTHVQFMSNQGRRERRAICGMDLSTSKEEAKNSAKALNSDRTSLLYQGHYDYDRKGKLRLYPAYISAARVAGAFSGVNPGTPLTNKHFKCFGLEFDLRNPTDTDELINAGIFCLENTDAGYKIVKSISTWLINDNYNRVEQSTGAALDYTVRSVRQALHALIGEKSQPLVLSRARSITESTLTELSRAEPQGPGIIVGDQNSPAFRNIQVALDVDVLRVQFECSPAIPLNYVLTTVFAVPYSGSVTI